MRVQSVAVTATAVLAILIAPALTAHSASEPKSLVIDAMRAELSRSMAKLRLKTYEAPYFIAYAVRDYEQQEVAGRFGAIVDRDRTRGRQAFVEVRVGDYQLDNSSNDRESFDAESVDDYEPAATAPLDDDLDALRGTLWLLTDAKYKRALTAYAKKRGRSATSVNEDEGVPSFSREAVVTHRDAATPFVFDAALVEDRVRRASAKLKAYPDLFDAVVKFNVDRVTRYFVNSEGTTVITERTIFGAHISAAARAKDGMLLEHDKNFYGRTLAELPDDAALDKIIKQLADELRALREAPVVDPYTGPALLMEEAAGVFFHETVGHRLEGERQNDEKEGRTFKGQVGQRVLPSFLSVIDDPTSRKVGTVTLNGWYGVDDEGVPGKSITLIDNGILRDYIKSRTPIAGSPQSNGHGRAEGTADPMGRMGNLFVRSSKRVPVDKLKKMLLEEVRKQGKPYGLIIRDITGGSTNTSNYGYQAFKGQPRLVYRVDAKTGKESLVRGVEMVGTPLTTVSKIAATSDTQGVFNGFCGAESGFVPVSTVAPAVLMTEIELQRSSRALERPPLLPPPWAE